MLRKLILKSKNSEAKQYYQELKKTENLPYEEIKKLQNQKLLKLINYAYENVPYYRDLFNQTEQIDVKNPNIDNIPILTKEIIKTQTHRLQNKQLTKLNWYYNQSGGSTGEPIKIIQDDIYSNWSEATVRLFNKWCGFETGDKRLLIWGSEKDLLTGKENIQTYVKRFLKNEKWINAFNFDERKMRETINIINTFKPKLVLAYVESIYELAKYVEKNKLNVYSSFTIVTTAGTLYPFMKEKIQKNFTSSAIINRYGSREISAIASECLYSQGLHTSPLTNYVEILRDDGTQADEGEDGNIVVTSLTNYAMPLIRYQIGDRGSMTYNNCKCGWNFQTLKEVSGRTTDMFIKENGEKIDGRIFNTFLWNREFIKKYQVVQEKINYIKIFIVENDDVRSGVTNSIYEEISNQILSIMGNDCEVEYAFVDIINPEKSGKYRYIKSKILE